MTMDVREKLVELLKSVLPNFRNNMAYWGEKPIYEFADCLLAHGVTVQEWISVKDRLPDETGRYLAVKKRIAPDDFGGDRTDIVIVRFFVDDGFRMPVHIPDWINKKINEEVTHWMPLPKPPKEVEE